MGGRQCFNASASRLYGFVSDSLLIDSTCRMRDHSRDLAESLVEDFKKAVAYLQKDHDEQADLLKQVNNGQFSIGLYIWIVYTHAMRRAFVVGC